MSSWTGLLERCIWPFTIRPLSHGSSWITEISVYPERCPDIWGVLPLYRCWQCGHCHGHGWLSFDPHPFFLGICQVQFPGREPFLLEGRVSGWKGPLAVSAPPAVPSLQGSRGRPCAHGTDQSEARRMHGCFLSSQKWLFSDKE